MNQRRSRGSNDKNHLDFVSYNAGGYTARHTPNEDPKVQTPQKVTGESKPEIPQGAAKASPNFKAITPPAKAMDKQTEKKVIAENSVPVEDDCKLPVMDSDKKNDATE
jgi:hypothetical protein